MRHQHSEMHIFDAKMFGPRGVSRLLLLVSCVCRSEPLITYDNDKWKIHYEKWYGKVSNVREPDTREVFAVDICCIVHGSFSTFMRYAIYQSSMAPVCA